MFPAGRSSRKCEDMQPIPKRKNSTGADMHGHGIAGALWPAAKRLTFASGVRGRFLTHPRLYGWVMNVPGPGFLLSVSILLSANGCAQPVAVGTSAGPSGAPSDNRSRAVAAYQANNLCMAQVRQANQAGASDLERARMVQDCRARLGITQIPITAGWQKGMELEQAGRNDEAVAAYQQTLNDEGYPNGDGLIAGERLGYMYASGRGVKKDVAKARQMLGVTDSERYRYDVELLDHNMLPITPEGKTPALIAQLNAVVARENAKLAEQAAEDEERARKERLANPQAAHAYDVAQCNSICSSRISSCNSYNNLDYSGLYSNYSHQKDCASFARQCYALCR